jgi:hypothetical protein
MSCTTISQLWKKGSKEYKNEFYPFKQFVTLHNQGKLDTKYYNGQSVCPKTTVSIQYLPLGLIVLGAALVGYAIAKK